ncbi:MULTISPECIES: YigZ family protein [unclassified Pseudovibrio]|uniref:YigZ family protein n=1 Tax=unclassified Pseudovibrio TaxID=2627060 RepID=UPI0007AEAC7E|nr:MULTISPECIES: YigZ family protein [unclassified Pseudovibrio]KZK99704.1 IMPACT family member YigZ [Pseudovibrio sp. W74]KZL11994.1 IMPACT family member YigZ [Pseudovibrio sp. Ad14]KZL29598.1 IMPACT family member YigZ [Pseudovibrio sp. Ad37]
MPLFTVEQEYNAILEEKKSRFLAFLVPHVDFAQRLADLRDEHKKANHHVTAFRRMLPEGRIDEGGKDDGEPAGTSGMPTLKTLIGADLVDVGVIIVRYFGGTKLGTGGLARAYSGAANLAIREAELVPWLRIKTRSVSASFSSSAELERQVILLQLEIIERTFTEDGVTLLVSGPEDQIDKL